MNHNLVEFEENFLSRTRDGKVFIGGIASVCECGWISPDFAKENEAWGAYEKHQAIQAHLNHAAEREEA